MSPQLRQCRWSVQQVGLQMRCVGMNLIERVAVFRAIAAMVQAAEEGNLLEVMRLMEEFPKVVECRSLVSL